MVPYGNRVNEVSYFSYPLLISEGKYAIGRVSVDTRYWNENEGTYYGDSMHYGGKYLKNYGRPYSENKITILNNYYTYGSANNIGLVAQNSQWIYYPTRANGYGTLFQDNYEDKPEIRVKSYSAYYRYYTFALLNSQEYYNKNGNATTQLVANGNDGAGQYRVFTNNQTLPTTYKTSTMQYQGMLPVFAV